MDTDPKSPVVPLPSNLGLFCAQAVLVFYIFGRTGNVATDISGYSGNTNSKITVGDRYATNNTAVPPTVLCLHLHVAEKVVVTPHMDYPELIK